MTSFAQRLANFQSLSYVIFKSGIIPILETGKLTVKERFKSCATSDLLWEACSQASSEAQVLKPATETFRDHPGRYQAKKYFWVENLKLLIAVFRTVKRGEINFNKTYSYTVVPWFVSSVCFVILGKMAALFCVCVGDTDCGPVCHLMWNSWTEAKLCQTLVCK